MLEPQSQAQSPAPEASQPEAHLDERHLTAQRNAALEGKRREILDAARAKMKAEFRQAQGIPPAPEATPAPAQATPQAPPPAANPNALAEAFTAQLNAQFQAAEKMRADAAAMAADAQKRAAEAEARLSKFVQNPASYLQENNLDLDKWNARLLNGGEPTAEEQLRAEVAKQVAEIRKEAFSQVSQVKQELDAQKRSAAVQEIAPVLSKEYPLVNQLLGADGALEELARQARSAGRAINPEQALAQMEAHFLSQYKATLQDASVATKLGVSVLSPQAEVAVQSPHTLTNRVTSTVGSQPTRPTSHEDRIARGRETLRKLIAAGQL